MRTAVAHPMPVANGVPLAAIGACEEVPPCCVTVISACACRHVAGPAKTPSATRGGAVQWDAGCQGTQQGQLTTLARTFSRERLGACES